MIIDGVVLKVKPIALERGIRSGRALNRATGINLMSCGDLWAGRTTRIDLRTLAILCKALACAPGDLLVLSAEVGVEFDPPGDDESGDGSLEEDEEAAVTLLAA